MKPAVLDLRPTTGRLTPVVPRPAAERKARTAAERVLYETHQRMGSIRDALSGHGPGGFPEEGELLRIVAFANITAIGMLLRAVEVFGSLDLVACVYTMNQRAVYVIRQLVEDGRIRTATILGSDTLSYRDPARICEMHETAALFPDRLRYGLADVHAKVMCYAAGGHHIVVSGSANLSNNAKIEDYVIANSRESHEHYTGWITELVLARPVTLAA